MTLLVLKAAQVFDGWQMHAEAAISLAPDGRIAGVHPQGSPRAAPAPRLGGGFVAAGGGDFPVNGGGG
ncbi:MAG: hypothetical protein LAT78_00600, partial [Roseinatronobacter sp.]|nr:hypothetical protein [Roseinatronobacter sp.]